MPYDAQGRWIEENEWEQMMREQAAQRVGAFSRYNAAPPSLYPNQAAPYGSFPYADPTPSIWDSSPQRLRQDVPADPKYQGWDFNQEPIADTSAISNVPQMAMTRHERSKLQLPIGPLNPLPDLNVPAFTPLGPTRQVPARITPTIGPANDPVYDLSATDPNLQGVTPTSMAMVGTNAFGIPDRTYGPTTETVPVADPNSYPNMATAYPVTDPVSVMETAQMLGSDPALQAGDDFFGDGDVSGDYSQALADIGVDPATSGMASVPAMSQAGYDPYGGIGTGGGMVDPTWPDTGGWGVPQETVSLPEVLGWAAVLPAAKGLVSMGKKGLDWMGPMGQTERWENVARVLDIAEVLGKYVGIPAAAGVLGYDALTESPEEFRQSVLEDVKTTPFSSTLDAATIGETAVPNEFGGYGIPSVPTRTIDIDRPDRTGRTGRTGRLGAAVTPSYPGMQDVAYSSALADSNISVQAMIDEATARQIAQDMALPDEQQRMLASNVPSVPVPAAPVSAPMAPRQQAMPAAVTPAPSGPSAADIQRDKQAAVDARNAARARQEAINAQMAREVAERQRQQQQAVAAEQERQAAQRAAVQADIAAAQAEREMVSKARALMSKYGNRDEPAENYMSAAERDIVAAANIDTFAGAGRQGGGFDTRGGTTGSSGMGMWT